MMNMKNKWSLFILLSFTALVGYSQNGLNTPRLDSIVDNLDLNNKTMFSVSMAEKGKVIYQRSIGWMDSTLTKHPNENTKYRIGSITKMFTSIMTLQLIEERKLKLKTTLAKFFPKVKNASKISIEDLLSHQSGIHNFTNDSLYQTYYTNPKSQKEMIDMIGELPSDFEPTTKQEYSNSNFVLLGYIIEKITKKSYATNLQERIVLKIGLKNTYYGSKASLEKNEARSFLWSANKWNVDKETDMSIPHGAGAIVSTTNDLVNFAHALLSYRLISKESLEEMTKLRHEMGLGIFTFPFYEKTAYGHNGGIDEFGSRLAYFPEDSLSIAITCNGSRYSMNDFMVGALSCYYNMPYEIPVFSSYVVSENILKGYVGNYHSSVLKMDLIVTTDGASLVVEATGQPPISLEAASETTFNFFEAAAVFEFKRDTTGLVNLVVLKQGGMDFDFSRVGQ